MLWIFILIAVWILCAQQSHVRQTGANLSNLHTSRCYVAAFRNLQVFTSWPESGLVFLPISCIPRLQDLPSPLRSLSPTVAERHMNVTGDLAAVTAGNGDNEYSYVLFWIEIRLTLRWGVLKKKETIWNGAGLFVASHIYMPTYFSRVITCDSTERTAPFHAWRAIQWYY